MKNPVAILEQFIEKEKVVTSMTYFLGENYGNVLPKSYAVFKVYDKKKRTLLQRLFYSGKYRKLLNRKMICSQVNRKN